MAEKAGQSKSSCKIQLLTEESLKKIAERIEAGKKKEENLTIKGQARNYFWFIFWFSLVISLILTRD